MPLKLPVAPKAYDATDQAQMRRALLNGDAENVKRASAVSFLLIAKEDGTVGRLTIDTSGTPVWTAL